MDKNEKIKIEEVITEPEVVIEPIVVEPIEKVEEVVIKEVVEKKKKKRKKRAKNKHKEEEVSIFTPTQLREALLRLEDVMDRSLMKWFLTGETAEQCYNGEELDVNEITGGVNIEDLSAGIGILKSAVPEIKLICIPDDSQRVSDCKSLLFYHEGVPIRIYVFHNKYEVFKNLDTVFYDVATFYVPNPMKVYSEFKETYE